jgi:type I restriction enzyme S subunit
MNVPKLRFGEFREEWTTGTLGELSDVRDGTHESPKFYEKGYPLVTSKNLQQDGTLDLTNVSYICHEDYEHFNQRSKVEKGDIVFGMIGTIGNPVLLKNENFAIKNVALIKEKQSLKNVFLINYLRSPNIEKQFHFANVGGTQKFIALGQIRKLAIRFPSLIEQQKIADFLSVVDAKITALTAQKTALTQYKQGMMQRIFSQTLRFKDDNGGDYPDWDSMRLEELGEFKSGVGFPENEQGGQEGVPFFKVSDMNLSENTFHMTIANHYVTEKQIKKLKLKIIKADAIIFAKVGAAIFLERKRIAKNFLIDNNMMAFIPKANLLFMKYLFETVQLSKFAQVGALPSYNSSDLGIIKVGLPNSYEEQTQIAQFLTELDDKINAVDAQIQSAQQWKQGLLQQMFV